MRSSPSQPRDLQDHGFGPGFIQAAGSLRSLANRLRTNPSGMKTKVAIGNLERETESDAEPAAV